jgi:hypothetical protein
VDVGPILPVKLREGVAIAPPYSCDQFVVLPAAIPSHRPCSYDALF